MGFAFTRLMRKSEIFELQHEGEKQLEQFRPQPAECGRYQRRVNHAIEKMLERDHPASAVPNRSLGVDGAISQKSGDTNDAEYLQ